MAEYIKRDALLEARELAICAYENAGVFNADAIRNHLKPLLDAVVDTPAADVAPVRHGKWIFGKDLPYSWGQIPKNKYHLYCSECLEQAFNRSEDNDPDFDVDTSYCPNCGAKMDLE